MNASTWQARDPSTNELPTSVGIAVGQIVYLGELAYRCTAVNVLGFGLYEYTLTPEPAVAAAPRDGTFQLMHDPGDGIRL